MMPAPMMTASAFSMALVPLFRPWGLRALHRSGAGKAGRTLFHRMQPDRPGAAHFFCLFACPQCAEREWAHGCTIGTGYELAKVAAGCFRQQHQHVVATALALAVAHTGAGHALQQILAATASRRQCRNAAIASHVAGAEIGRWGNVEQRLA